MSAEIGSSSWYRFLLAPSMLAVVIASPLASIAASQFGMSFWPVFLVISGGLAIFWDLALYRDDEARKPLHTKEDPVIGPLLCFEQGLWEAREQVQMGAAWLQVLVEAGEEGPSGEQQEAFREYLRDPNEFRAQIMASVTQVPGQATHPGVVPMRVFLPAYREGEEATLEVDVRVDGDETGPMEQVIQFRGGQAMVVPVREDRVA